mmetsp:Transcript_96644/g.185546  ORF Transcript_96644/g.185546 Transcript_96644/m.185546 type:complete len:246 (-) Transcript_96644:72-809(-)
MSCLHLTWLEHSNIHAIIIATPIPLNNILTWFIDCHANDINIHRPMKTDPQSMSLHDPWIPLRLVCKTLDPEPVIFELFLDVLRLIQTKTHSKITLHIELRFAWPCLERCLVSEDGLRCQNARNWPSMVTHVTKLRIKVSTTIALCIPQILLYHRPAAATNRELVLIDRLDNGKVDRSAMPCCPLRHELLTRSHHNVGHRAAPGLAWRHGACTTFPARRACEPVVGMCTKRQCKECAQHCCRPRG